MRTVLVTGGAGYVGAHGCKALRKAGFLPVVIDNLSMGHESFVRWGPLIQADIRNEDALTQSFSAFNFCAVLHFAASACVAKSVTDPQEYYENNVVGTLTLLRAMRQADCRKIVFSSSCAVYGAPGTMPIDEATPMLPINPYGFSKAMGEQILRDYERAYDLGVVSLRYFNACGADPDGEIGELRDRETHVIPRVMMSIQGYLPVFSVFGTDYATFDGTAIRDYVHVTDLAAAHVASLQQLLDGGPSGRYNLGTGQGYSVKQVLEVITAETGERLKVLPGPRRPGDPAVLVADASLAKKELHFQPKHSDLKTVVATAWAWHRQAHPRRPSALKTQPSTPATLGR